jgi:hypothetical protein
MPPAGTWKTPMKRPVTGTLLCLAALIALPRTAAAVPLLQLDIAGGHYDAATQTIMSNGPVFSLTAVLTPQQGATQAQIDALLADTYYVSGALTPQYGPAGGSLGSFSFGGTTDDVTQDMFYGTPPMDTLGLARDPGDLQPHGIYPTYFDEFGFQFSPTNRAVEYNTADNPGGLTPSAIGTSYYASFAVDTRLLDPNYFIHFDLYDTLVHNCGKGKTSAACVDIDVNHFAPFSHDAQSSPPVPEPATMLLIGSGIGAGILRRLRRKAA